MEETPAEPGFLEAVEAAHAAEAWRSQGALAGDFRLQFGANEMGGHFVFDTPVGKARFEVTDGPTIVFDGEKAWISPAEAEFPRARFHVLTWPYFMAAPMKLGDPGTRLTELGDRPWRDGEALPAARLEFEAGVGDSPDDWYVVYRDPATDRVAGMGYIVTWGGVSAEEAEAEPHAITYGGYEVIDGVPLSTTWDFWLWGEEQGIHGEPIGHVEWTNLEFVEPAEDAFVAPEGAAGAPLG